MAPTWHFHGSPKYRTHHGGGSLPSQHGRKEKPLGHPDCDDQSGITNRSNHHENSRARREAGRLDQQEGGVSCGTKPIPLFANSSHRTGDEFKIKKEHSYECSFYLLTIILPRHFKNHFQKIRKSL